MINNAILGVIAGKRIANGLDPFAAQVVLLMRFNGTNGSTTMTDDVGSTFAASGSAQLSTSSPITGSASLSMTGTGNVLRNANSSMYSVGSGDFTIEVSIQTSVKDKIILEGRPVAQNGYVMYTKATTGRAGLFVNDGGVLELLGTSDVCDGNVHHIAWVRQSGVLYVIVDGVVQNSVAMAFVNTAPWRPRVGASNTGGQIWNGKIDNLRMTLAARPYTSGYTPAFPFLPIA